MSDNIPPDSTPAAGDARARLLRAGLELFARRSYEGVGTRELARKAHVNIAAIPYYYGGKEGLYRAVMQHIADSLRARLLAVEAELGAAAAGDPPDREQAFALLQTFIRAFLRLFLLEPETRHWSRIILREQLEPTPAFTILYDGFMRGAHAAVTRLVACITGTDPEAEVAKLRAQAVLGQVVFFNAGREVVFRRTGWQDYDAAKVSRIATVLAAGMRGMLGLPPAAAIAADPDQP